MDSPNTNEHPLPQRWMGLLVVALTTVVWIGLTSLQASPSGYGTHTQLNLPSCGYLMRTGYPCPGCGVTTSLTHYAPFQWPSAISAHAFGLFTMLTLLALMLAGGVQCVTQRPALRWLFRWWKWWLVAFCFALFGGWVANVLIGKAQGIYPL
jgi:hypothetical protein